MDDITVLRPTLSRRPRGLHPPDQRNDCVDPSRVLSSPRVPPRREGATPVSFPEPPSSHHIPRFCLEVVDAVRCGIFSVRVIEASLHVLRAPDIR